jgi:O-glycosyl hydrolase
MIKKAFLIALLKFVAAAILGGAVLAQEYPVYSTVPAKETAYPNVTVDFDRHLRPWDGFGVNYVETSQTRDYAEWSQDYGGFSELSEAERQRVIELIFGTDGLQPGITKMFLDIWHEGTSPDDNDNGDPWSLNMDGFDHERTTRWIRYFNREGLETTRARGGDLKILTTMYGAPPWMTRQGYVNGRDLAPDRQAEMAEYMVSWVKYLRSEEDLPVEYLSLHNEGDAYYRWPPDGTGPGLDIEDYNLYWPAEQVVEMLPLVRRMLDKNGLGTVALTPGETQNWYRFDMWGYAPSIVANREALSSVGLITSHSFAFNDEPASRFYGDWRSNGVDQLRRAKRESDGPGAEPHAWVMSMSWGDMDADFVDAIRRNIYITKVNALTPWAVIQRPSQWKGGDPNPKTAFHVTDDGDLEILQGYYFYKQVTRAGQPGMSVAQVTSLDPGLGAIAFASNGTDHPNAFVLVNIDDEAKEAQITLNGADGATWGVYRSSETERYDSLGTVSSEEGQLTYDVPARSVTTFYAR